MTATTTVVGAVLSTVSLVSSGAAVAVCAIGTYLRDRQCSKNVGLGMELCLAAACASVIIVLLDIIESCIFGCGEKNKTFGKFKQIISIPSGLYGFSVFVYLCVQVFGTSSSSCYPLLYKLGLAYCIVGFVGIGVVIVILPILVCLRVILSQ
ncbi:MAG: hypothetical protein P4L69_11395 [Desulfosporosinus sp.]|nr:hypothetical protein [Desulfosporosinus sp.]